MKKYVQGKVDCLVEKAISRKFLAWVTATGLTYIGHLESGDWVIITAIFIGMQGTIDAIAKLKGLE